MGKGKACRINLLEFIGLAIPKVEKTKPRRVPDLVDKVAIPLDSVFGKTNISPLCGKGRHGKTQGIGAVFIHNDQGVHDIALGLAHLLSFRITHKGVQIDIPEGRFLHEVQPHHHHAGNPEKQNVKTGDKN